MSLDPTKARGLSYGHMGLTSAVEKPWGRLEAWREIGAVDGLGDKFELVTDNSTSTGVPIAEGNINL